MGGVLSCATYPSVRVRWNAVGRGRGPERPSALHYPSMDTRGIAFQVLEVVADGRCAHGALSSEVENWIHGSAFDIDFSGHSDESGDNTIWCLTRDPCVAIDCSTGETAQASLWSIEVRGEER